MSDRVLNYTINGDASKLVAAYKEAAEAEKTVGKNSGGGNNGASSSAGGGAGAGTFTAATRAAKDYSKAINQVADTFTRLDQARAKVEKNPAAQRAISQRQVSLLKEAETLALRNNREEAYAKLLQKRLDLETKIGKNTVGGQLRGAAFFAAGRLASDLGSFGGQLYSTGAGAYNQLNQAYTVNPGLRNAQFRNMRAQLALGQQLSGYETFRTNVKTAVLSHPLAGPLSVAGDALGATLPAAGSIAQVAGALKLAGLSSSALATAGKAGVLGLAGLAGAGTGLLLGSALKGNKPEDQLELLLNPKSLGVRKAGEAMDSEGFRAAIRGTSPENRKKIAGNIDEELKLLNNVQDKLEKFGKGSAGHRLALAELKKHFDDIGEGGQYGALLNSGALTDKNGLEAYKNGRAEVSKAYGGKGLGDKSLLDEIVGSPQFKLRAKQVLNQIGDFNYDNARQEMLTRRNYARQKEDLTRQRGYEAQDYGFTTRRFGITRTRSEEDYTKQLTRLTQDSTKNRVRADEDYTVTTGRLALSVYRTKRDYTIQLDHLAEDSSRTRQRREEDVSRTQVRLAEDTGRELTRLNQASARDRFRSDQDYFRGKTELERNASRSITDLNRNFQDSLVSIVAPGLAGSKGYQLMKLFRDYRTQKQRLGEDVQFGREGLEISHGRAVEDIGRNQAQGTEDITRQATRGTEDITRDRARAEEDQAREESRASLEALKQITDALKDSELDLSQINVQYGRSLFDLGTETSRAFADINQGYARSMQDLQMAEEEAAVGHQRALAELALAEKRGAEDFTTAMEDIKTAAFRFQRDMGLQFEGESLELQKQTGLYVDDMGKLYAQSVQNITDVANTAKAQLTGQPSPSAPGSGSGSGGRPLPPPDGGSIVSVPAGAAGTPPAPAPGTGPSDTGAGGSDWGSVGSYATGLALVPANNYPARLHQGEMIVPRRDAETLRRAGYDPLSSPPLSRGIDFSVPSSSRRKVAGTANPLSGIGPDTLDHRNRPQDLVGFDIAAGRKQVMDSEAFQSTHGYLTPAQMLKGLDAIKAGRDPSAMPGFAPPRWGGIYGASIRGQQGADPITPGLTPPAYGAYGSGAGGGGGRGITLNFNMADPGSQAKLQRFGSEIKRHAEGLLGGGY